MKVYASAPTTPLKCWLFIIIGMITPPVYVLRDIAFTLIPLSLHLKLGTGQCCDSRSVTPEEGWQSQEVSQELSAGGGRAGPTGSCPSPITLQWWVKGASGWRSVEGRVEMRDSQEKNKRTPWRVSTSPRPAKSVTSNQAWTDDGLFSNLSCLQRCTSECVLCRMT